MNRLVKRVCLLAMATGLLVPLTVPLTAQASSIPSRAVAKLSPGNAKVKLTWPAPAANGSSINGYQVAFRKYSAGAWRAWSYQSLSSGYRSKARAFANGTKVQAKVRAKNARGYGTWSVVRSTTSGIPGTVTTVTSQATASDVTARWSAPVANGGSIRGYSVRYRLKISGSWRAWSAPTSTTNTSLWFTQSGANDNFMQFQVSAKNAYGSGGIGYSNAVDTCYPREYQADLEFYAARNVYQLEWYSDYYATRDCSYGGSFADNSTPSYKIIATGLANGYGTQYFYFTPPTYPSSTVHLSSNCGPGRASFYAYDGFNWVGGPIPDAKSEIGLDGGYFTGSDYLSNGTFQVTTTKNCQVDVSMSIP